LRILPINVGRTNVQNPLDFLTALLVDRHKRGRLRHQGGIFVGIRHALGSVRHRGDCLLQFF